MQVVEMLDQIRRTGSLAALWSLMVGYSRELGFGAVAYVLFDRGRHDNTVVILENGLPAETISQFGAMGYGRNSPLLRIVMTTGQPQLSSRAKRIFRVSRAEAAHRDVMRRTGISDALAFPLYGPQGRDAMAVLTNAPEPELYDRVDWGQCHAVAQSAHLRAFALMPRQPVEPHGLSSREVEILRWVAQGKSNGVIADILEISGATVDTYLRRVFEKLDVADRTSAAVKAVGMGLIRA